MTEHDAATVARATLWLDTSNETSTRPAACADDSPTTAFERPPAERASAPVETAVLDRASAFAAFEASPTDTFDAAGWPRGDGTKMLGSRGRWQHIASHAVALVIGAASVACALAWVQSAAPSRTELARKPQAERAAPHASALPNGRAAKPLPPAAPFARAEPATLSEAVDALARGDYETARALYGELARQRPNDAALAAIAAVLAQRVDAHCDERTEGPCAR